MSFNEYEKGLQISSECYPFYALIQAAMRDADTDNLEKLKTAFPEVWWELQMRYNAPGGRLPWDKGIPISHGVHKTDL